MKDVGAVHIAMLERLTAQPCGKSCDLPQQIRAVREAGLLRFMRRRAEAGAAGIGSAVSAVPAGSFKYPGSFLVRGCPLGWPETSMPEGDHEISTVRITAEVFRNSPELKKQILEEKRYTKWLSCDTIGQDIQVRTRRPGDYLIINSSGGKKKLKDYMIDCKIPREKRDSIWLLADGSHILWIIGWRISEAVKVTSDTRRVVRICVENI